MMTTGRKRLIPDRLRLLANRWWGTGPFRAAPLADILARRNISEGVHQPESIDGVLAREKEPPTAYRQTAPLVEPSEAPKPSDRDQPRHVGKIVVSGTDKVLMSLSRAGVLGADGLVYCPVERTAIDESIRRWSGNTKDHPAFRAPRVPPAQRLEGLTLDVRALSAEGFYHFLIESLPRLHLLREYLRRADAILANGTADSFHSRWWERAGVPAGKIRWMGGLSHYTCEQLLFTNYLNPDCQPTEWTINSLRTVLGATAPKVKGGRWIWISRADAQSRRPEWEGAFLRRHPRFESVVLSALTPQEQIDTFRQAAVIAGPHGAGLANLVFSAPATRVIEFVPSAQYRPVYDRLAQVCRLDYAWVPVDFGASGLMEPVLAALTRHLNDGLT